MIDIEKTKTDLKRIKKSALVNKKENEENYRSGWIDCINTTLEMLDDNISIKTEKDN